MTMKFKIDKQNKYYYYEKKESNNLGNYILI